MKEHGILFKQRMHKAVIDLLKTQRRRIIKPQPDKTGYFKHKKGHYVHRQDLHLLARYQPGDRLYIKEGKAEYTVIDYTPVELAFNHNYFLLDTASLVPQTYYLDIKAKSSYEVNTTKNVISFNITNQVDERKG